MTTPITPALPVMPTKLYIPPPRPDLVARPRLLDRLDAGLQAGHRVTVVTGLAGSGKTTLVADWIYSPTRPVASRALAWLSLDRDDNDPVRFLTHLVAALRQIAPGLLRSAPLGQRMQGLPGTPQSPRLLNLMTRLMAELAEASTPGVLVLDDVHLLTALEIHQALDRFLAYQPAHTHLVMISREQPPFTLAPLRVRGSVTEIGDRDLRFTSDEARQFLRDRIGGDRIGGDRSGGDRSGGDHTAELPVSDDLVAQALARTEGWVAGLQLLALAARREAEGRGASASPGLNPAAFTDGSRYAADYLLVEVLSQQPPAVRAFLRATAILEQLSGSLCDAVADREHSAELLERLVAAGLFVTPLDDQGRWYRYHPLLAETLVNTLEAAARGELHRRASLWYEAHDSIAAAVQHALAVGDLVGDWGLARRLIGRYGEPTARRGEVTTVKAWLEALPADVLERDAELITLLAWILAMSGDLVGADVHARAAAAMLGLPGARPDEAASPVVGKLRALQSFIALLKDGDNVQAMAFADAALARLPTQAATWRILALWSRAEAQERLNRLTGAINTLWEAQRLGRAMPETLFALVVEGGLIKLLNDCGRRRDALAVCDDALSHYRDADGAVLPLAGYIYSQLGGLQYEANALDAARASHDRALALSETLGLDYQSLYQRAMAAPTWYALGEVDRALAALQAGYLHATHAGYADAAWFSAWETNIRLWQGDLVYARHWSAEAGLSPDDEPRLLRIEQHVTYARFLIATGRGADARRWLARLEAFTHDHHLVRWLITIHALQAVVADGMGDRDSAHAVLTQALRAAAPEGYVRAFLVEGARLIALLRDLRHVAPSLVDRICRDAAAVYAGDGEAAPARGHAALPPLVEPLTDRELEVLHLIAGGATNREIAEELVIVVGTVKRHTSHIYAKLQVHNRTEAVARARDLGLLIA